MRNPYVLGCPIHPSPHERDTLAFVPGQRWYSLTEPEFGLGLVEAVEGRQVVIAYPARAVVRRYATADPPLVRAQLAVGQQARGRDGAAFHIEEVVEADGLLLYRGEGHELSEADLDAELDVATPENRLQAGQVDSHQLFDLRHDALRIQHQMLSSPARGFLGGRIQLFDHQLSIARDVCERHRVRVLLADEVGLGKTIEALLILHRMLLSGRIENALVLVPPALVHQWLAEAYLRFNLLLRVVGHDTHGGGTIDPQSDELPEALLDAQLFICPLGADVGEAFLDEPWDIVIVDEAHHLQADSHEFGLVEALAERVEHLLLLTATPDRGGEAGHFRRLALLDPARFHDEAAYRREASHYRELAAAAEALQRGGPLGDAERQLLRQRLDTPGLDAMLEAAATDRDVQRSLLARLLDLHGIGRVMFRNVRARIPGFPQRQSPTATLRGGDAKTMRREFLADLGRDEGFVVGRVAADPRTRWLSGFLDRQAPEKVLVLCANRDKVEAFAAALTTRTRKVARFHEDMGAIERDRQAAWFLDEDGPQVVISSAIGAEGRNFQVARHLVLLDLPLSADRLEQAIGRIDRIGQGDTIYLHAPVVAGTPQARLRRWHAEALRVFERPWHGAPEVEREFGERLVDALLDDDPAAIDDLVERGRRRNDEIVTELEEGRDRLLELTSFDVEAAQALHQSIVVAETSDALEDFMVDAFERGGLDVESIGPRSYALRAGADYHRPFPGFVGEEMGVTFDRATALAHPERALLSWDHPMVRDTLDNLLAHETGNATVARLESHTPGVFLEALYVAEPTIARDLRADRFFPPTPIRVVVDASGEAELEEDVRHEVEPVDHAILELPQLGALLPQLLESARAAAESRGPQIATAARQEMRRQLDPTLARLAELVRVNPSVSVDELEAARAELTELDEGLQGVRVRLDALRLIVAGALG